jgi:formate hydrogenlyase subunit 3/multisubunit Na+/H+ antiporter MnhD subunit
LFANLQTSSFFGEVISISSPQKRMNRRTVRMIFNIAMLILGLILGLNYWQTEQFSAIKQVSVSIMVLVIIYIALHFFKRLIYKTINWWDWLYYIALVSIALPVLFANSLNENFYHWILDLGCTFFIIPVLVDMYDWWKNRKTIEE